MLKPPEWFLSEFSFFREFCCWFCLFLFYVSVVFVLFVVCLFFNCNKKNLCDLSLSSADLVRLLSEIEAREDTFAHQVHYHRRHIKDLSS